MCTVLFLKSVQSPMMDTCMREQWSEGRMTPITLLWAQINFPCWNQGYCGHMPERGVSIQLWEFLIHQYPTKTSANSGEKAIWLEVMLLLKNMKHVACENQPMAAVVLGTLPALMQPRCCRRRCHSPSAWRRQRKEAIRAAAFLAWSPGLSRARKSFRDMGKGSCWPCLAQMVCHGGVPWHIPQQAGTGLGCVMFTAWSILITTVKKLEVACSLRRPDSRTTQGRHFFTDHQL